MTTETGVVVYRLHVWIRQISPMIWRRLLIRSDSTIADLHYTLQIARVEQTGGWTFMPWAFRRVLILFQSEKQAVECYPQTVVQGSQPRFVPLSKIC